MTFWPRDYYTHVDRLSPVDTEKIWYKGFTAVLDTYIYDKWLAPMTLNDTHQRLCGSVSQNNPIFYVRRSLYVTIQKHFGIKICRKFPGLIQKILLEVFGFYLWCRKFMKYICRLVTTTNMHLFCIDVGNTKYQLIARSCKKETMKEDVNFTVNNNI